MAAFGTFLRTSELYALNHFPVGSSVSTTPGVPTVPVPQALLWVCAELGVRSKGNEAKTSIQ